MDEVEGIGHRIVAPEDPRGVVPAPTPPLCARRRKPTRAAPFSALIKASATVTIEATLEEGES